MFQSWADFSLEISEMVKKKYLNQVQQKQIFKPLHFKIKTIGVKKTHFQIATSLPYQINFVKGDPELYQMLQFEGFTPVIYFTDTL